MQARAPTIFSLSRRMAAWNRMLRQQRRPDAARFLYDEIAADVIERIGFMQLEPRKTLLLGVPIELDVPGVVRRLDPVQHDEELPLPEGGFDLILAMPSLATINDLPGALVHLNRGLSRGGILLANIVGAGSMRRLRASMIAAEPDRPAARMHPLIDNRSATALLERAGFRRFVVDSSNLQVAYRSLDRLVHDLRDQGLSNQLMDPAPALTKASLERARQAFLKSSDDAGRIVETFELLTLTGWKD